MVNSTNKNINRLLSLDVFRGITVALMILVNSPGNQTSYFLLEHSAWNGCTLADIVFSFFIFIVGVSCAFTLNKARVQDSPFPLLFIKILNRSLILFLIGLFLNAFPHHFDLTTIRVYGVLQRIAICYFVASILFLTTRFSTQLVITIGLMVGYWLLMTNMAVPGYGLSLSPSGNFAAFIDRTIFSSRHLYGKTFDPEGLLSTIPAIATALIGCLTGSWLLSAYTRLKKVSAMVIMGVFAVIMGALWGQWFPINKSLWTSSYVLWTGGLALLVLAICYWLIEIKAWVKWSKPFELFGKNAMLAFFLHVLFLKIQAIIPMPLVDGSSGNLRLYIAEHLFGWASLQNASLMYACSYAMFWLCVLLIYSKKKSWLPLALKPTPTP